MLSGSHARCMGVKCLPSTGKVLLAKLITLNDYYAVMRMEAFSSASDP